MTAHPTADRTLPDIKTEQWNNHDDASRPKMDAYRRRSPDRRQRSGRVRSRSPTNVDRYQPDRARDDHYSRRDDGRRPPPLSSLPNDYQVGFNWFAEWWRMEQMIKDERERQKSGTKGPDRPKGERELRENRNKDREQIQAAYDAYREKWQVQMSKAFVQLHKDEEWFKEKYDQEIRQRVHQKLNNFRRLAYGQWEKDLEAGLFDSFTLEGIYKNDSNGAGGIVEKEEGEASAANEVLGVGDLVPLKGGDLRDEAVFRPTLLIKTIAPSVSRDKLEDFCKEHLGEGDGGFQWLSLSDPNTSKRCHRIGWVVLNPAEAPDEAPDERGDGRDGDAGEREELNGLSDHSSKSAVERAAAELNGKPIQDAGKGDFICHVGVHEPPPAPRKKALWDLFSAPERIGRDLELALNLVSRLDDDLGEGVGGAARVETRVDLLRLEGKIVSPLSKAGAAGKTQPDADSNRDTEMKVGAEEGEEAAEFEEGAIDEEDGEEDDDDELLEKKKKLDLLVEYLRRVYSFCFFCVFECDSVHELVRKCPGGHLRRPRSSLTTLAKTVAKASALGEPFPLQRRKETASADAEGGGLVEGKQVAASSGKAQLQLQKAYNWVKTYEEKLLQLLDPDSVDLKKIGGRPLEDALEEELSKFVKQEDESKYRCKVPDCSKLFKGQIFWKKHVEKRHNDFHVKIHQELKLINTYVLDPSHIAPSRSDSGSNGHFPPNHHAASGTPRGFNLAGLPFGFMPNGVAGMPNPQSFLGFGGPHAGKPVGWAGPTDEEGRHQAGPRRHIGRYNNVRMAGPYDRAPKDMRNMRWSGPGRSSPPRAVGRGSIPRFADGGAATVGPREAVQGRSLKSYEDLDAVGGSGDGELNY